MNSKGVSPPPRFGRALAISHSALVSYLTELDIWFRDVRDAFPRVRTFTATLSPSLVAANTTSEQAFVVAGLATDDIVYLNKPSHDAGLGIVGYRVSAVDTLRITFMNATAGDLTPATEDYFIVAIRR